MEAQPQRRIRSLTWDVTETDDWLLPELESGEHHAAVTLLAATLRLWAQRQAPSAVVVENLACRWRPTDRRVGVAPNLALVENAPNLDDGLERWRPGHAPPRLAVEFYSSARDRAYYGSAPARYGVLGAREIWLFDPKLLGVSYGDGVFPLHVWCATADGMGRIYPGKGPARSRELGCWLVPRDGRLLLADDEAGTLLWPSEAPLA